MALLTIAALASNYARTALSPLQEAVRLSLTLSDNQMALLQGAAMALPLAAGAIPLGLIIDRYSRVRLLTIFGALNIVGCLLTASAANFFVLFLARCLNGIAIAAIGPAVLSLVADLYVPAKRGRAAMLTTIGGVGGIATAFALGGALVAMFGTGPNGWRWAMAVLTAPLAIVAVMMLALREPSRTGQAVKNPSLRQVCSELWRYRTTIAPLVAGWIMVGIGDVAALVWAAPTLSRSFGLPPDRIGTVMAAALLLSGVLGPVAGGVLADVSQRFGGPRRTIASLSGLALLGIPASLFAVAPGVASASILLFTFMTIGNAISVMTLTLSIVVVPNELRGLCIALFSAVGGVFGIALAPLTVSLLSNAIGGPAMIGTALAVVAATTAVLGAVAFAVGSRYFPRDAIQ
jgi:MFS family permease